MSEKICKMSLELARINNSLKHSGGAKNTTYNTIIDPVTYKNVSLYSNEGKTILKNLIDQYKRLTVNN